MYLLVTAGGTIAPIDRVRCIANVATGRTGAAIALAAHRRGHRVALLTSRIEAIAELHGANLPNDDRWSVRTYRSFDELRAELASAIRTNQHDAIVHSAAVSDYQVGGIYAP